MNTLSIVLIFIVLICFIFGVFSIEKKRYFLLFGLLTHLCLFFLIKSYIGKNGGSPQLSEIENRRFEHYGYFIKADGGKAVFTRNPQEKGFPISNLGLNDSIVLTPVWDSLLSHKIDCWNIKSLVTTQPLRINDSCINVTEIQWLNNNDSIEVVFRNEKVNIQFNFSQNKEEKDLYIFRKYRLSNDSEFPWIQEGDTTQVPFKKLKEGYPLYEIAKKCKERAYSDSITRTIFLTREVKGDLGSRLGFLVSNEAFRTPAYSIFKNGQLITSQSPTELKVQSKEIIKFGYGNTNIYGIQLSDESIYNDNEDWAVIKLLYPKKWILPENKSAKILITSSKGYTNFDYYYQIDLGEPRNPFYAVVNWKRNKSDLIQLDSVIINKGDSKTKVALNQPIFLGNGFEGVLLKFTTLKSSVNNVYWYAIGALILSFILFLAYILIRFKPSGLNLINESGKSTIEKFWLILWITFITILFIRLIIAYRIDILPPENATLGELSIFKKSLNIAILSPYLIPIAFSLLRLIFSERLKFVINWTNKNVFRSIVRNLSFWGILAITIIIPILGNSDILGENQALFGIRVNILSLVSLIIFLFFITKQISSKLIKVAWRNIIFYYVVVLIVTGLNIASIGDTGFIIFLPIFAFVPALWVFWDDYYEELEKPMKFVSKVKQNSFWIPLVFLLIGLIVLTSTDLPFAKKLIIQDYTR